MHFNIENKYNEFRLLSKNFTIFNFINFLRKNKITIQQNKYELHMLYNFLKKKTFRSYMEIGVFQGGSALFFSLILENDSNILLCDSLQAKKSNKSKIQFVYELLNKNHNVSLFFNKSRKLRKHKEKYDLCFIDGNHQFFYVVYDLFIAYRMTNIDGIIVLHDINNYKTNIPYLWKLIRLFSSKTKQIISKNGPNAGIGLIIKNKKTKKY